jgi:hypothetical protein
MRKKIVLEQVESPAFFYYLIFIVVGFCLSCNHANNPFNPNSNPTPVSQSCSANFSNVFLNTFPTSGNWFLIQNASDCTSVVFQVDSGIPITLSGGTAYAVGPYASNYAHTVTLNGCNYSTAAVISSSSASSSCCNELHFGCIGNGYGYWID